MSERSILEALSQRIAEKVTQVEHYRTNEAQLDHAKTIAEGRIQQANQIQFWIGELLTCAPQTLPSGVMTLLEALRDCTCPRPANTEPDDLTVGQCYDKLQCGCQNGVAIAAATGTRYAATSEWLPIDTAPRDGTPIIGGFHSIRWADSHRKNDIVRCWYQPEFEAFISSCREMQMHNGYTFADGSTRELHSPVIEPVTHWMPMPTSPTDPRNDRGSEVQ